MIYVSALKIYRFTSNWVAALPNGRGLVICMTRNWVPAALLLAVVGGSAIATEGAPTDPHLIAALYPPWWTPAHVLQAAAGAGDVLGFGGLRSIVVLHADQSGLQARAMAHGAILTFARTRQGLCIS